jgi:phosphomannomutase/phosphoglucomutase
MLKLLKNKKKEKSAGEAAPPGKQAGARHGIAARGNALRRVALSSLLVALVPTLLGFIYLTLVREPAVQQRQIGRIADSFATQQATNIHYMVVRLGERVAGAAQSPLALSALASQSPEDLALVEQAMLDHFPEVVSLRIIPIGDMGTATLEGGNEGLRNHIEVDLVRRTSEGETTQPESYRFENRWLTSLARLVTHPRLPDRQAVILVTLDNDHLAEQLKSLDTAAGKFALEQVFSQGGGKPVSHVVASTGSGSREEFTRRASIPDTPWQVAFTPSHRLVESLSMDQGPLLGVLALAVVSALAATLLGLRGLRRTLETEANRMISAADKKTPLELGIPELVSLAKQLRRVTLRALRQEGEAAPPPALAHPEVEESLAMEDLANPMFHSGSILDDENEEVLELDLAADAEAEPGRAAAESGFPEHIFRAYDIRGHAERELTDVLVTRIGRAIGTIAGEMEEQTLIVGCDGRTSSPRIKSALIRSLMESGRDVIDIGLVPTPLLYFATRHLNCRSGIMITGSHNPAEHNGFKIVLNQQTIAAGGIQRIRDRVVEQKFSSGNGRMIREEVVEAYCEEVIHDIAIAVPLKIVIDAGNGATSDIAPQLFEELGCEVVPLYCDVNGNFPNHPPDTSNEDNLADLCRVVQEQGADFGVAFDGDGDRLAVVSGSGRIVRSDKLLMIYAQDVVSRNPGADVVFDVKCTRDLTGLITRNGGRPILWKTGHAFMKQKMAETGALLGGEFSGHIFFGERWYGFDDGMYAAGRLAEILSTHGNSLDEVLDTFPATFNTPEILIPVPEERKFPLMERLTGSADFPAGKVNTLDGIRVDFAEGWGLVRASNTSAALTARFEANSAEALESIKEQFRARLAAAAPDLELNF